MKYGQLSDQLLEQLNLTELQWLTPRQASAVISKVLGGMAEAVSHMPEGEVLSLQGFGKFYWKTRPERTHWNMKTKQVEKVPAMTVLVFEPARRMRRKVRHEERGADRS